MLSTASSLGDHWYFAFTSSEVQPPREERNQGEHAAMKDEFILI